MIHLLWMFVGFEPMAPEYLRYEGERVEFKLPKHRIQYANTPLFLRLILEDADNFAKSNFGKELVVTRVSDRVEGESGVHGDFRAVDVRDQFKGEFTFTENERKAIVHYINAKYPRKDKYAVCLWHSFDGGAYHFHFQVPRDMKLL